MRPLLLAAGYLNVDVVASVHRVPGFGERVTASCVRRSAGGMTANAACAASRLGLNTRFFGSAGSDPEGEAAVEDLRRFGVGTSGVGRTGRPTTTALVMLGPDGDRAIISEPMDFDYGALEDAIRGLLSTEGVCLHLDGYRLPEAVPLLERAKGSGLRTSADLDGMEPEDLALNAQEIARVLDVAFLNWRLASALGPTPEGAITRLIGLGIGTTAITLGEQGALVGDESDTTMLPAPPVEVVDTTGAGDAFAGAFLTRLMEGGTVREVGSFAVAAAAISTTGAGARGRLPTRREVEEELAVADVGLGRIGKGAVGDA